MSLISEGLPTHTVPWNFRPPSPALGQGVSREGKILFWTTTVNSLYNEVILFFHRTTSLYQELEPTC